MPDSSSSTLATIRRLLLALLVFGMAGTTAELWLMGHYEDWKQLIPFGVMALSTLTGFWHGSARTTSSASMFRLSMLLLMVAGATGSVLHYRANMEFQLEMDPTMGGMALLLKVLHAKAPPALAPGNMALLGLLGLVSTLGISRTFHKE
ncbi:MAG: hypothetical protein IPL75_20675 [Acidobacteria bacterium]|jgi:hypothetical protein|nr:hypothetical protein [Acidobacteriota bacterium]